MDPLDVTGLLNIPYLDKGRDAAGVDCYGLVRLVLARIGVHLPTEQISMIDGAAYFDSVDADRRTFPGDVLVLSRPESPLHLAVVVDGEKALHATTSARSRLDRVDTLRRMYRVDVIARPKSL